LPFYKNRSGDFMRTFFNVLLSICLAVGLSACGSPSDVPEQMGKDFFTAVYDGDSDKALQILDIQNVANENLKNDSKFGGAALNEMMNGKIKGMVAQQKKKTDERGGLKDVKVVKTELNKEQNAANISYEIFYKNSDVVDKEQMSFVKKDNKWQIEIK